MRFYYFSLFSWMAWALYGAIAIAVLSLLWAKLLKLRFRNPVYWILVAAVLVAPWGEELWIAYTFDRLCRKDAGVFIDKTVEVDGYYNDTGKITRLANSPYKFIESRDDGGKFRRVERATEQEKADALAWYRKTKDKEPDEREWFTRPVSEDTRIVVEMDTGNAWRVTKLDKPSAQYQFKTLNSHTPVAHQVKRFEDVVVDNKTGEVLGRYTNYYRGPYWFFLSLGTSTIPCAETQAATRQYGSLIYSAVLKPSK